MLLGRRGLLLPNHLPLVVKVLLKALVYEETHGIVSAGSYVRDSACYTSWSLARAYDPEILKPYVNELAGGLLIVASFDREVDRFLTRYNAAIVCSILLLLIR